MATSECPHCGSRISSDVLFCDHCGTALPRQQPPDATDDDEVPEEPDSSASREGSGSSDPEDESQVDEPAAPTPAPADAATGSSTDAENEAIGEEGTGESGGRPEETSDDEPGPLLDDLGGLLDLADIQAFATACEGTPDPASRRPLSPSSDLTLDEEQRRQLRQLFAEELPPEARANIEAPSDALQPGEGRGGLERRPWLELVLFLGLVGALLGAPEMPRGGPQQHALPGLNQAIHEVESLAPNSLVLVNWAYDPATAGEMDFVAQPVVEDLLRKEARLIVVSQLPGGPAAARRVIAEAAKTLRRPSRAQISANKVIEGGFLPGGAASLPILGAAPGRALPVDPRWVGLRDRFDIAGLADSGPVLSFVFAAGAEDVRRWLEQIQPFYGGPVVAVTTAVADTSLRPYLHSGQLSGLVSGWDGGRAYIHRTERTQSIEEQARSSRLVHAMNWGVGILIAVILLGNLVGLTERRPQ